MGWFGKPSHEKSLNAVCGVACNIYEQTTDEKTHGIQKPKFLLPDSPFRYLMFSLATAFVASAGRMKNADAVLNDLMQRLIVRYVMPRAIEFFGRPIDPQEAADLAGKYVKEYLDRWSAQIDIKKAGNYDGAIGIVTGMIRNTESEDSPNQEDRERIFPLARWITENLPAMTRAFEQHAS